MSLPRNMVMDRCNPHLFRGIPKCPECDAPAVRLGGNWVCKTCVKFFQQKAGHDVDEGTPIGELFPNRAARRAAVRGRRR